MHQEVRLAIAGAFQTYQNLRPNTAELHRIADDAVQRLGKQPRDRDRDIRANWQRLFGKLGDNRDAAALGLGL